MTASDLLAAHLGLRAFRPDEDAFYHSYAEGTAVTILLPTFVRLVAQAASLLARRATVARTG
jgi:hypothetical protein